MTQAKENADYLIKQALEAGITSDKALANFMGQMQIECGGFKSMNEKLGYSGSRLLEVFPGRNGMDTIAEANAIAKGGPEVVANAIYGGQWGKENLGNTEVGDGWKYHGRGYVQLTGRSNYEAAGKALGLDLVNHPELAADREIAAKIAIHYWQSRVVPHQNQEDIKGASYNINGGYNHLAERKAAAHAWEDKLKHGYVQNNGLGESATQSPDMHYNGSQLEPVKKSSLDTPDGFKPLGNSADTQTRSLYAQAGIDFADGGANTVAAITYLAAQKGITEIEHITVKDGQIHIAQKDPSGFGYTTASIDAVQAANTDYSKSMDGLAALSNPQQVASLTPEQNKTIDEPTKARSIA